MSSSERLNTLGFGLAVLTLLAGLGAAVSDSLILTGATLAAQLAAMLCFTRARRGGARPD